jgi:hypothetical protein
MKTREIMKAVLFVAGIIMLTAACKKDEGPTLDFDITVPTDWKYYVLNPGNDHVVYYAQSPMKGTADTVTEDLVISKFAPKDLGLTNEMTLTSFYTAYVGYLDNDTTYHALSTVDTTINGEDAIKLTHLLTIRAVNTSNGDTVYLYAKLQKYLMMNNSYGYALSFNALVSTFDEYQKTFDEIVATFKFKK